MCDEMNRAASAYETVALINEEHRVYLVQHKDSKKFFVKKRLDVYNEKIYAYLQTSAVTGIPHLAEMWQEEDALVIVEEYISGCSVEELMEAGGLTEEKTVDILCRLCTILEQLHNQKPAIVHRDIKPSNVMVTPAGRVVLLDFNAAKYVQQRENSDTVLLGTQGYAAPEQYGFGSSTPQTDIYALGVMLKEMLDVLPRQQEMYQSVVETCTQMDPQNRMKNVAEVKAALASPEDWMKARKKQERFSWKSWIPPGYRTKTPWKMLAATVGYVFVMWLTTSIKSDDVVNEIQMWTERIFCFAMLLISIFVAFNYRGIRRWAPFQQSQYKILQIVGVVLMVLILLSALMMVMVIVEDLFVQLI